MRVERQFTSSEGYLNLGMAEVRLFTATGMQYTRSQLNATMSSVLAPVYGPDSCLDGNVNTLCHTDDSNAWLSVTYPCKDGLSRVEVVNRVDCCQSRILQFRMRALAADGASDLALPYTFSSTQAFYMWQVTGTPSGKCRLTCSSLERSCSM